MQLNCCTTVAQLLRNYMHRLRDYAHVRVKVARTATHVYMASITCLTKGRMR